LLCSCFHSHHHTSTSKSLSTQLPNQLSPLHLLYECITQLPHSPQSTKKGLHLAFTQFFNHHSICLPPSPPATPLASLSSAGSSLSSTTCAKSLAPLSPIPSRECPRAVSTQSPSTVP
ncbi:hypothetical protein CI238_12133, partial [Colletotrichum incanum]